VAVIGLDQENCAPISAQVRGRAQGVIATLQVSALPGSRLPERDPSQEGKQVNPPNVGSPVRDVLNITADRLSESNRRPAHCEEEGHRHIYRLQA
jgi:hypothetical protein